MQGSFLTALLCTTLAGLCTGLGGLLVLWQQPGLNTVSTALGFAGGVMLSVSFSDLVPAGLEFYARGLGRFGAGCAAASLLLCGMALAAVLEAFLPQEAALLAKLNGPGQQGSQQRAQALHCGLAVGLAMLLHNLPEGVLTLFAGAGSLQDGLRFSMAIALHNVPEGISVAAPLWYATHSRAKSAGAAFASGLAEPMGALLAWCLLHRWMTPALVNGMMLLAAGVMCYVSVRELLFGGFGMGRPGCTAVGFAAGAAVMTMGIAALG